MSLLDKIKLVKTARDEFAKPVEDDAITSFEPIKVEAPIDEEPQKTNAPTPVEFDAKQEEQTEEITAEDTPLAYDIMSTVDPEVYPPQKTNTPVAAKTLNVSGKEGNKFSSNPVNEAVKKADSLSASARLFQYTMETDPAFGTPDYVDNVPSPLKVVDKSAEIVGNAILSTVEALDYFAYNASGLSGNKDIQEEMFDSSVEGTLGGLGKFASRVRKTGAELADTVATSSTLSDKPLFMPVKAILQGYASQLRAKAGVIDTQSEELLAQVNPDVMGSVLATTIPQTANAIDSYYGKAMGIVAGISQVGEKGMKALEKILPEDLRNENIGAFSKFALAQMNETYKDRAEVMGALSSVDDTFMKQAVMSASTAVWDTLASITAIKGGMKAVGQTVPWASTQSLQQPILKLGKWVQEWSGNVGAGNATAQTLQRVANSIYLGAMNGATSYGSATDRLKIAKTTALYMSTTAVSGHVVNPTLRKSFDFLLNSGLSTTLVYSDLAEAVDRGDMTMEDAFLAAIPTFVTDAGFSAMTDHIKSSDLPIETRTMYQKIRDSIEEEHPAAPFVEKVLKTNPKASAAEIETGVKALVEKDKADTSAIAQSGTFGNVIKGILKHEGSTVGQKEQLAKILSIDGEQATGKKVQVVEEILNKEGRSVPAQVTPDGTVQINKQVLDGGITMREFAQAMIHETGHLVTMGVGERAGVLFSSPEDARVGIEDAIAGSRVTEKEGKTLTELAKAYEIAANEPSLSGEYGTKNFGEFIAEIYANRTFQKEVSGLTWEYKNLFERIGDATKELLGIEKEDVTLNNVFNDAFDLSKQDAKYDGVNDKVAGEIKSGNKEALVLADNGWIEAASAPEIRQKTIEVFGDNDTARQVASDILGRPSAEDVAEYNDATAIFNRLSTDGGIGTKEWTDAWARVENVKNKYGGMPPTMQAPPRKADLDNASKILYDLARNTKLGYKITGAATSIARNPADLQRMRIEEPEAYKQVMGILQENLTPEQFARVSIVAGEYSSGQLAMQMAPPVKMTPEIRSFIKDSMTIDENGYPVVFYHGSKQNIGDVVEPQLGNHLGWHIGTVTQAEQFTRWSGGNMTPVITRIKNPLRVKDGAGSLSRWVGEVVNSLEENGKVEAAKKILTAVENETMADPKGFLKSKMELGPTADYNINRVVRNAVKSAGYDSIVYRNEFERSAEQKESGVIEDSYIVIDPTTVKSVFNRGAYNRNQENMMQAPPRADYVEKSIYDMRDYLDLKMGAPRPELSFLKNKVDEVLDTAYSLSEPLNLNTIKEIQKTGEFWGVKVDGDTQAFLEYSARAETHLDFIRDFNSYLESKGRGLILSDAEMGSRVPDNLKFIKRAIQNDPSLSDKEKIGLHSGLNKAAEYFESSGYKADLTTAKGVGEASSDVFKTALYAVDGKAALEQVNVTRLQNGKKGLALPPNRASNATVKEIIRDIPSKFRTEANQMKDWMPESLDNASPQTKAEMAKTMTRLVVQRRRLAKKGNTLWSQLADMRYVIGDVAIAQNNPALNKAQAQFFKDRNRADFNWDSRSKAITEDAGASDAVRLWIGNNNEVSDAMIDLMYYRKGDRTKYEVGGKEISGSKIVKDAEKTLKKAKSPFGTDTLFKIIDGAKAELNGATKKNFKINAIRAFGRAYERDPSGATALLPTFVKDGKVESEAPDTMIELWNRMKLYGEAGVADRLDALPWGREVYWPSKFAKGEGGLVTGDIFNVLGHSSPISVKGAQTREKDIGPNREGGFFHVLDNHGRRAEIQALTFDSATAIMSGISNSKLDNPVKEGFEQWLRSQVGTKRVTDTDVKVANVNAALQSLFWVGYAWNKGEEYTLRNLGFQPMLAASLLGTKDGTTAYKNAVKSSFDKDSRLSIYMNSEFAENLARDQHIKQSIYNAFNEFFGDIKTGKRKVREAFGSSKTGFNIERGSVAVKKGASNIMVTSDIANRRMVASMFYSHADKVVNNLLAGKSASKAVSDLKLGSMRAEEEAQLMGLLADGISAGTRDAFEPFVREYSRKRDLAVNLEYKTGGRSKLEQSTMARMALGVFTYKKGISQLTYTSVIEPLIQAMQAGDGQKAVLAGKTLAAMTISTMIANTVQELIRGRKYSRDGTPIRDYTLMPASSLLTEPLSGIPTLGVMGQVGESVNEISYSIANGTATEKSLSKLLSTVLNRVPILGRALEVSSRGIQSSKDQEAYNELLYLSDTLAGKNPKFKGKYGMSQRVDMYEYRSVGNKVRYSLWEKEADPEKVLTRENAINLVSRALLNYEFLNEEKK